MTSTPSGRITTPLTGGLLRGALDLERTGHGLPPHGLPARARARCADPQPRMRSPGRPAYDWCRARPGLPCTASSTPRGRDIRYAAARDLAGPVPRPRGHAGPERAGPDGPGFRTAQVPGRRGPAEVARGGLTPGVVRESPARIVRERAGGDPALHRLDGRGLHGASDLAELPLPDGLRPDAAAHRRSGERFASLALRPGGPLGRRSG